MAPRAKGTLTISVIVPIVAAVLAAVAGGVAGKAYDSLMAYVAPGRVSGSFMMLEAGNGPTESGKPPLEDTLTLQGHDDVITGTGQHGDKQWSYSGYLKNGYLVLAYRSSAAGGSGLGTYVLADQDGTGHAYVGYFEGNVCPERRLFRCNAVLLRGAVGTQPNAAETFEPWLSAQCTPIAAFGETSPHPCGGNTGTKSTP